VQLDDKTRQKPAGIHLFSAAIVAQLWHVTIAMTKTASLAEVLRAGVTIEAEEAVAIAQQLIASLRRGDRALAAAPPYGPPTPDTVTLGDDGSVTCCACETTPAVSEIAILLQSILRPQARVPGGLRYTIARALLDVDVPPFDSLADLADTLTRYERGARSTIVARVMQRYASRVALVPLAAVERRRHPRAADLRRSLREADARLYLQKVATDTVALTVTAPPRQPANVRAGVACVAAGLLMIATGEIIDLWPTADPAPAAAAAAAPPAIARDISLPESEPVNASLGPTARTRPEPRTSNLQTRTPARTSNLQTRAPERRVPRSRRAPQLARTQPARDTAKKPPSRSVLQRLRLNWLRNALTSL
jgi:hypothetical protein